MSGPNIDDLDFTGTFTGSDAPEPKLTAAEQKHIDDLGMIGATALKSDGYYARIVNAETLRAPADPGETTVLVIEDDPGTAAVILKVLDSTGYMTRHAANREQIVEAFSRKPLPDLVLLDVMLPGLNGFDVLNRIRHNPRLANIPVIMLTSLSERADIVKGLCYGADGYLTKPALPSALIEAVRAVSGAA
jgi:CheY-like chemotaxis protein